MPRKEGQKGSGTRSESFSVRAFFRRRTALCEGPGAAPVFASPSAGRASAHKASQKPAPTRKKQAISLDSGPPGTVYY